MPTSMPLVMHRTRTRPLCTAEFYTILFSSDWRCALTLIGRYDYKQYACLKLDEKANFTLCSAVSKSILQHPCLIPLMNLSSSVNLKMSTQHKTLVCLLTALTVVSRSCSSLHICHISIPPTVNTLHNNVNITPQCSSTLFVILIM